MVKKYGVAANKLMDSSDKKIYNDIWEHYQDWGNDNDIRRTRVGGWNDVTDAYWGELPVDWPYASRIVDPRIRTSLIDKDARLINNKLRGRLVPREGSDVLSARINNAVLDFQWDTANHGGSMEDKLLMSSQDTRLYGSKFARVIWKKEICDDKVIFEGNEFEPLDIRDCGLDPACNNIKDAKWFQLREWVAIEDLEKHNKTALPGAKFKNLDILKGNLGGGDKRSNRYQSRVKELKGLEDRLGRDSAFPVVELVTEYRKDRWISFAPRHGVVMRDIKNPYDHYKIPIVQLKYYSLQDDPLGESEVEPVLPLWRSIQAVVCGFLDEMNIKMRPPLKIVEGQARIETIVYGPEAQWLVARQDAVEEMRSDSSAIINFFQTTYSSLVSAFNTAMGDLSQGVSQIDPFNPDKTATEVKATVRQQNVRDQRNQNSLSEFITDIMMMWQSNNKQFLFTDPKKQTYLLKIIGNDNFEYFKRAGLDEMEVPDEAMEIISETIGMQDGNLSDGDIMEMLESAKIPKYPVEHNKEIRPKMRMSDLEDSAELILTPEDVDGTFDYIPDVKSMSSGADQELQQGRLRAIELLTTNQAVSQQLISEGYQINIKELLTSVLEDQGLKDADRFFTKANPQEAIGQAGGAQPNIPVPGLPGVPQAGIGTGGQQPAMAQSTGLQNGAGIPQGL